MLAFPGLFLSCLGTGAASRDESSNAFVGMRAGDRDTPNQSTVVALSDRAPRRKVDTPAVQISKLPDFFCTRKSQVESTLGTHEIWKFGTLELLECVNYCVRRSTLEGKSFLNL